MLLAEEREEQLKELYDSIRYSFFRQSKEHFKVFTYEASLGKTTTMCRALSDLYKANRSIHTLIVTKLKDEQGKIVNDKLGDIAIIINADENVDEKTLYKYPVLVITHARYELLCKDKERRDFYIKGRTNLIIDEQLDLIDVREYNHTKALEMRDLLSQLTHIEVYDVGYSKTPIKSDLARFWGKIIEEVNKSLSNNYQNGKMKFVLNENNKVIDQIDLLNEIIDKSKFPKKFKNENWKSISAISYKSMIKNYIEGIKYFFNNSFTIAYGGRIYAYNPNLKYFMLDNNIMLDASGKFLELYKISNMFKVIDSERIIQHSNTTLTFIQNNSTTNAIEKNEDYFKVLADYIKVNITEDDKVLIIGRRNDEKNKDDDLESLSKYIEFEKDKIEFINYDAMRGKNDWGDFNKCFCVHTPNKPFHFYPLQYLYYKEDSLLSDDELEIERKSTNMGFKDETLENLRITDVVSSIYQGLKRINRNNDKECNYYVVVKDKRIQNLLIEQFNDLKEIKYDELKFEKSEYDMTKRNANSYSTKFIKLIKTISQGEYKKKDICIKLGMKDSKHFSDKVLTKDVKEFINTNSYIKIEGQKIIINEKIA